MTKGFKIFITIFLILLFAFFFWAEEEKIFDISGQVQKRIEEKINEFIIREARKQIFAPPPLLSYDNSLEGNLTQKGVIYWTNIQRNQNGLSDLRENPRLNASAEAKLKDMFENQYFAHYSSSGIGVGDLAQENGYEFVAIGENLALGNFENDRDLVQKWMESLSHRSNILNPRYQDIGVAVGKGIFEGKPTWIAVQHFGLPLSACPQPEDVLRQKIDENQKELNELQLILGGLQEEIKNTKPKWGREYKEKISEYNNLVQKYNNLLDETKALVDKYNHQVTAFNDCISGTK